MTSPMVVVLAVAVVVVAGASPVAAVEEVSPVAAIHAGVTRVVAAIPAVVIHVVAAIHAGVIHEVRVGLEPQVAAALATLLGEVAAEHELAHEVVP